MIKGSIGIYVADWIVSRQKKWIEQSEEVQNKWFTSLIQSAKHTAFGKEHGFSDIKNHSDFQKQVPLRSYEDFEPYIHRIIGGERDVLWKGLPLYFAKTSGTTSGVKYIPISKDSISNHFGSARDALMNYIHHTRNAKFLDKKMIFLSGSPELETKGGIHTGRLSGIVNHHIPSWLRGNQMPSYATNCIEEWEEKLDKIVEETFTKDMSLISGIPPWVQMYFDRLHLKSKGKRISEIFPNLEVFVYGGVNFSPYKDKIQDSIGKKIGTVETFPASEGFFAYQDTPDDPSMLLLLNTGIFYEFIPVSEIHSNAPKRLSIAEISLNVPYALVITSNAGLWSYLIGDTITFLSKNPYKIIFSGRVKHFISAFGEHVIGSEVESAMLEALNKHPEARISEFTVAPLIHPEPYRSCHEWYVAFSNLPKDLSLFSRDLDQALRVKNIYYDDLVKGKILRPLEVIPLEKDAFELYMKSIGKLGGQNKVPRLTNDRIIATALHPYRKPL